MPGSTVCGSAARTAKHKGMQGLPSCGRAGLLLPGSKPVTGGEAAAAGGITQLWEYRVSLPERTIAFIKRIGNEVGAV